MKGIVMTIELKCRRVYAIAGRHRDECYNAVVGPAQAGRALAWLVVRGKRESLVYAREPGAAGRVVAADTYVLSPLFAGGFLLWVERRGTDWPIRAVNVQGGDVDHVVEPFEHTGRAVSLSSCEAGETTWLVWEEREGRRTRVRIAGLREGRFTSPVDVTDGRSNAYDPACAVAADGTVYVVYCAFLGGNYCIVLQKVGPDGTAIGEARRVSTNHGPSVWPSVAGRTGAGAWISYTEFSAGDNTAFVQHGRSRAQHGFFGFRGESSVRAGVFDGEKLWAPFAPPQPKAVQGPLAAMRVFGSSCAGHSHIFEDYQGRVRLIFRQHNPAGEVRFPEEDRKLDRGKEVPLQPGQVHPDICVATLLDDGWSEPVPIVKRAHFEAPVSYSLDGDELTVAFAEDGRRTGWNVDGEWFDHEGELRVGTVTIGLSNLGKPEYELRPFVLTPTATPSMEEPDVPRRSDDFIYAIGQTHSHCNISVCQRANDREPHLNYRFMQDVQHCDFGAVADHAFNMWQTEMLAVRKMAQYYYFPGEFVAIAAYEWTGSAVKHEGGPFGHVNPLWLAEDGDLEFYTPCDPECAGGTLERLWQAHSGQKVITPPHHVADNLHPYFWHFFDDTFTPVVELFQDYRGSAEKPWAPGVTNNMHKEQGHWVLDGLRQGKRFGFIGGGDHGGVARGGVLVKELTRTGLYEAFMARRCFATTGLNLRLKFTANSAMMGSAIVATAAELGLSIQAAEPIMEVQIVRNGEDVDSIRPAGAAGETAGATHVDHTWRVERREPGEFWYCRVVFENGEMAWSSPIWLD